MTKPMRLSWTKDEVPFKLEGGSEDIATFMKNYSSDKTGQEKISPDQRHERMFALSSVDKKIVTTVLDFIAKNGKGPTPTQVKRLLDLKNDINYITRKISTGTLARCLKFEGGEYKGKQILPTPEFLRK